MLVDARGIGCPKPVIMAEEALSKIDEGIVDVLVDNEASANNLARFASKNAFYSETAREDSYWRIKIVKGYPCEVTPARVSEGGEQGTAGVRAPLKEKTSEQDLLLVIASDVMGKDEGLGRQLMKAFLETMKVYKQLPHTIFFLNAGVKLATVDEEVLPILREFEAMGVEMYSCGTCLKYYQLDSQLKVGHWGTMNNVVEGMQDFKKTVWVG